MLGPARDRDLLQEEHRDQSLAAVLDQARDPAGCRELEGLAGSSGGPT